MLAAHITDLHGICSETIHPIYRFTGVMHGSTEIYSYSTLCTGITYRPFQPLHWRGYPGTDTSRGGIPLGISIRQGTGIGIRIRVAQNRTASQKHDLNICYRAARNMAA